MQSMFIRKCTLYEASTGTLYQSLQSPVPVPCFHPVFTFGFGHQHCLPILRSRCLGTDDARKARDPGMEQAKGTFDMRRRRRRRRLQVLLFYLCIVVVNFVRHHWLPSWSPSMFLLLTADSLPGEVCGSTRVIWWSSLLSSRRSSYLTT